MMVRGWWSQDSFEEVEIAQEGGWMVGCSLGICSIAFYWFHWIGRWAEISVSFSFTSLDVF